MEPTLQCLRGNLEPNFWWGAHAGTGAVKLTPAHDPNDLACAVRHGLAVGEAVLGEDGRLTAAAGEGWEGVDRFDARELLAVALEEAGLYRGKPRLLLRKRRTLQPIGGLHSRAARPRAPQEASRRV